jgi:hypothetical protein
MDRTSQKNVFICGTDGVDYIQSLYHVKSYMVVVGFSTIEEH